MLGFRHIENKLPSFNRQLFISSASNYTTFNKPAGASQIFFIVAGAGSGGGGGRSRTAGTAGGGGGGGGAGALVRVIVPTIYLPDTIHIRLGAGGNGGAVNSSGTAGTNTVISAIVGSSVQATTIIQAAGGRAAGGGQVAAAGTAGSGGAAPTSNFSVLANFCPMIAVAGAAGVTGGVHTGAVGNSVSWGALGQITCGGAGGAGCTTTDFDGGGIASASGLLPNIGGHGAGQEGAPGLSTLMTDSIPAIFTGGGGGASNNSGTGGKGGQGAPGCGGGGGGAGTTGGIGGKGGDGFVLAFWW